jgi:acyl-CoA synthetase (AMP-forming)/AMP-acid ligase II
MSLDALVDSVTTPERRARYLESGLWTDQTVVAQVAVHAETRGDAPAVVDLFGRRRMSYRRLAADANRVANLLLEEGLEAGDVVALQLPSWYETVAIGLGVAKAGGVVNPMLPIYRAKELGHMLGLAETRFLFTPARYRGFDHRALITELPDVVQTRLKHFVVEEPGESSAFLESLNDYPSVADAGRARAADEVAALFFTSGTEAQPKAVMHTEQTINFTARSLVSSLGIHDGDVVWMPSPVGHSTGFIATRLSLNFGLKLVLQDRWDAADAARLIESERCTYTSAAATFLQDLVDAGRGLGCDLSSLRLFRCGGAPVPAELVARAAELGIFVLRIYGSTEALSSTGNRIESPYEKRVGTDGFPIDHVEVEIRRDDGTPTEPGEAGEVFVRGPNTSVGFLRDQERTAAIFDGDGWVGSGDLAVMDGDGYISIVGRKKEIIIRGGLNVAPREVEELLLGMPNVLAAAVVGIPHPRLGETGCAFLVVEAGAEIGFEAMVAYLRGRGLAAYKLPERLELVEHLPMTPSGKVQKHLLASQIASVI